MNNISLNDAKHNKLRFIKLAHFMASVLLFATAWLRFRYHGEIDYNDIGFRYNYFVVIAYAVLLLFFTRTYNAYLLGYSRVRDLLFSQITSQIFSVAIIYAAVSLAWNRVDDPMLFVLCIAIQAALDIIWDYFANKYYFKLNPSKKAILIYRDDRDKRRFGTLAGKKGAKLFKIKCELEYNGEFSEIEELLKDYEAIFVAGVNSRCRNGILKYCKETNTPGYFLPHVGDIIMQDARYIETFDAPLFLVDRKVINQEFVILKRLFDFVVAALGLVILSPVMLITAIIIKLYDGGPAIYRQARLTKDGKEFIICKFRSMIVDAEYDGIVRLSTGDNDSRVTPFGRVIRKCRIDELPQLWNIMKGDMSFVGPRPERPELAEHYCAMMPDFQLRLQVKAGLTGYAQVYGKYNTDPYEKLEYDLMYIKDMSALIDLRIMFATFRILFKPESTEGIDIGCDKDE